MPWRPEFGIGEVRDKCQFGARDAELVLSDGDLPPGVEEDPAHSTFCPQDLEDPPLGRSGDVVPQHQVSLGAPPGPEEEAHGNAKMLTVREDDVELLQLWDGGSNVQQRACRRALMDRSGKAGPVQELDSMVAFQPQIFWTRLAAGRRVSSKLFVRGLRDQHQGSHMPTGPSLGTGAFVSHGNQTSWPGQSQAGREPDRKLAWAFVPPVGAHRARFEKMVNSA